VIAVLPWAAPAWPQSAKSPPKARPAPEATLGELSACRTAADEPICLLRLASRSQTVDTYALDINLAYAPEVLAAIGPAPAIDRPLPSLSEPADRAAIAALLADGRGQPPRVALAPIFAMTPEQTSKGSRPADPARAARFDAAVASLALRNRVGAYKQLWEAAHGPFAIPSPHRPSRPLIAAVLDAWEKEAASPDVDAADLIEARVAVGDERGAERAARALAPTAKDEIGVLLAAGLLDEASAVALRPRGPAPATDLTTSSGRLTAMIDAMKASGGQTRVIQAALKAGRKDIAAEVARQLLDWVQANSSVLARDPLAASMLGAAAQGVAAGPDRVDAERRIARLAAAGRPGQGNISPAFAAGAVAGWRALGETTRAQAIVDEWRLPTPRNLPVCVGRPDCPAGDVNLGFEWALMISGGPPAAGGMMEAISGDADFNTDVSSGRTDRLQAHLARAGSPQRAVRMLVSCVEGAAGNYHFALARLCATELSQRKAYRPRALLYAANAAAGQGDAESMNAFMALTYEAAAAAPADDLPRITALPNIAISQLRAQGRL
jgi:hypothetical protein